MHGRTLVAAGVEIAGAQPTGREELFTTEAVAFVAELVRRFRPEVHARLTARKERHVRLAAGEQLRFLPETRSVREGAWRCAPLPASILDRRVEITGPVDRKMIINALNSGASVFMADFEDANSPTAANCFDGQLHLRDAVNGTISFEQNNKHYALNEKPAVLFVRPRGFHLSESHFLVDGEPSPGMLVDFGFFFFHNAKTLVAQGRGPFFYLPKMESHLEARVWNDIFVFAQSALGLPLGSIKATCLVETLPGAFEIDEILFELRQHSAGLNCGRWDYIFSFIKTHQNDASRILPDRGLVTMTQPFMRAYSLMVIQTCHKRGVHAMGGMAAQIPVKGDEAKNNAAFEKVRADKLREAEDGHDGTWVAHPALVPVAKAVFDAAMPSANQIDSGKQRDLVTTGEDLLRAPEGAKTEHALRHNLRVGVQYIEAWLRGSGAVPLYDLMEDAATAEISRAQTWQWMRHGVTLDTGLVVTEALITKMLDEELAVVAQEIGAERFAKGRFAEAKTLMLQGSTDVPFREFLTLAAYEVLKQIEA